VFISYSHSEPDEVRLAGELETKLQAAGCEVFIDTSILVGTDWVEEIERRIHWCDFFVALLSERAVGSEMVQGEIRMAVSARQKQNGRPGLLPIRVRYFGPLDYELDSYLARVQYVKWQSASDTAAVIDRVIAATRGRQLPEHGIPAGHVEPEHPLRPLPRVDPRRLSATGGALASDDPLYVERTADDVVRDLASQKGQTLVIKGPRQIGKSSLLLRYLAYCAHAEPAKTVALVDLSVLAQQDLTDYSTFLSRIARVLLRTLRIPPPGEVTVATQQDFTWFVEDHVLSKLTGPSVFAFDTADRILGRPYQSDFFTTLRLWHNSRSNPLTPAWETVDLALVVSTEPYLLIGNSTSSIFNVGRTLDLPALTAADYGRLNAACGGTLTDVQIDRLWQLLGGHPYLTRLAFYRLFASDRIDFETLMSTATDERGPFGEHLRATLLRVHPRPDLVEGLKQVLGAKSPGDDLYYRLNAAGLVRHEGKAVVMANQLYGQFFKAVFG
jgi:AAA-like domain/TIR domain